MSSGIYSIGVTGMNAAQLGLVTTEHNIANATTAGYNRQRTIQVTNIPIMTGAGAVGQGTRVSTIERMYSQFIAGQVNRAQAGVSELDAYYAEISQIDNMLADPNSGVSTALQEFFLAAQQVAANPASMSARQAMVSTAEGLVSRYQSLHGRLTELADGVNGQIGDIVGNINAYAQQIAELNDRIVIAESSVLQPANDLRDQRDQLVSELNKLVRVQVIEDSNGSYNIFIGSGQQLVVGTQVQEMTATASAADITTMVIGLRSAVGTVQELPDRLVNGGQLGGLLRFRNEALSPAFNQLGRVAASMALTFNAQHALGQDLLGQSMGNPAIGGNFQNNFFNISSPAILSNSGNTGTADVVASFISPPIDGHYALANNAGTYTLTRLSDGVQWSGATLAALQAALPAGEGIDVTGATVAAGNTVRLINATAQSANFYTNLSASDYRLSRLGANYTLTRLDDNQQWTAASLSALSDLVDNSEGFTLSLASGAIADGDSFVIQPTRQIAGNIAVNANIASDPRLLAAAMPVRGSLDMANTGSAAISNLRTVAGYSTTPTSLPLTLTYNAGVLSGFPAGANVTVTVGGATLVDSDGAIAYNPATGAQISINGIAFDLAGTPDNGDVFRIERNASGNADGRNILALGKLQTQKTMAGGTASYQEAYAQLVSDNGNRTRQIEVTKKAQEALLEQATSSREAMSGVNLDEEAANLIRYQQAYQASAKMLQIGSKLFETLLALG
ncbi:MAG: Flagellar hook-associated protein 1 [Betaproteobacteria bacterium ADurb.Bin341]|nr:MAG: Flagellar hook-associated protein 1 [Betaproteobacteria bacterium ADurb.Bin341]